MNDKLRKLLASYDDHLAEVFNVKRCEDTTRGIHESLPHVRWMLQTMLNPPTKALKEKLEDERELNRWLGFIQGVLWTYNGDFPHFSLTALRAQTRNVFDTDTTACS